MQTSALLSNIEALNYSSKLISQRLNQDLLAEKELKAKIKEYEKLGKDLLEISKKSTEQVMVRK